MKTAPQIDLGEVYIQIKDLQEAISQNARLLGCVWRLCKKK
jgi:hypothetical protein